MSVSQADKAKRLRALHEAPGAFVIPNPWDAGSARVLEALGFQALATSSGAKAGVLGKRDGKVTREESLANARLIAGAVDIPVIGDLEKGFGDTPDAAALTIKGAAEAGLVGGSIEDATGNKDAPLFDLKLAAERVAAASKAAKALPFPFVLTARAEGFLRGKADLDDVIARLKAYEAAGADVLFAPGLPDLDAIKKVTSAIGKPFNFMVGIPKKSFSKAELEAAGVKRISLATSLWKAAMTGLIDAATEVKDKGTFSYVDRVASSATLAGYMKE
ncbi:MAG: isocitrate lyase/phosphoenolpyruvate mutase family protein [Reyranellales bacterium]